MFDKKSTQNYDSPSDKLRNDSGIKISQRFETKNSFASLWSRTPGSSPSKSNNSDIQSFIIEDNRRPKKINLKNHKFFKKKTFKKKEVRLSTQTIEIEEQSKYFKNVSIMVRKNNSPQKPLNQQ